MQNFSLSTRSKIPRTQIFFTGDQTVAQRYATLRAGKSQTPQVYEVELDWRGTDRIPMFPYDKNMFGEYARYAKANGYPAFWLAPGSDYNRGSPAAPELVVVDDKKLGIYITGTEKLDRDYNDPEGDLGTVGRALNDIQRRALTEGRAVPLNYGDCYDELLEKFDGDPDEVRIKRYISDLCQKRSARWAPDLERTREVVREEPEPYIPPPSRPASPTTTTTTATTMTVSLPKDLARRVARAEKQRDEIAALQAEYDIRAASTPDVTLSQVKATADEIAVAREKGDQEKADRLAQWLEEAPGKILTDDLKQVKKRVSAIKSKRTREANKELESAVWKIHGDRIEELRAQGVDTLEAIQQANREQEEGKLPMSGSDMAALKAAVEEYQQSRSAAPSNAAVGVGREMEYRGIPKEPTYHARRGRGGMRY